MTRTSAGTKSLDATYYVSQEIYAQESTRIFGQAWMCVGREEQIAQVGDYILADVNEESLLVVRTRSKKIACYFNVCRHRGTRLLSPHPDFVLSHRIGRMSIDRTRVVCEFLFHADSIEKSEFDSGPAVEFWDRTNRQDWHVCELIQQGVCSRAYEPGPYANQESVLVAFDRHYLKSLE